MRGSIIISDFILKKTQMLEEQMVTNVRHTHTLPLKKQRNEINFIKKKTKNMCLHQNQNQHHSSCFCHIWPTYHITTTDDSVHR